MAWAKLTDKATGEVHWDCNPDGVDTNLFDVLLIVDDRCPDDRTEDVDANGNIYVVPEKLKAVMWERVKAIRSQKEEGTAPTPVGVVQIDESSKAKIMGALAFCKLQEEQVPPSPFAMNFTLADNSRVTLNNTTVRQMAGAAGKYVSDLYDYSWTLRDQLEAATTVDELSTIDVTAGWPQT